MGGNDRQSFARRRSQFVLEDASVANFFVFNLNVNIFVRGFSRKQKVKPNTLFVFVFVAP